MTVSGKRIKNAAKDTVIHLPEKIKKPLYKAAKDSKTVRNMLTKRSEKGKIQVSKKLNNIKRKYLYRPKRR